MSIATYPIQRVPHHDVVGTLERGCQEHGLDPLAGKLAELRLFLAKDLDEVDRAIAAVGLGAEDAGGDPKPRTSNSLGAEDAGTSQTPAQASARHLLAQDGKRLRPIVVALAAHVGKGFNEAARAYAVAVELVHNATLLHDDVVDVGARRRGADAARVIYGNAASIFGGDWLLVEALCRIQRAGSPEVLARMLDVIKEMVIAESMQLARRGKLDTSASDYFHIVDGKTASLFRWAMFAGGRAGGVSDEGCEALVDYGKKLGVAFQLVDDVLDVAGDPEATGKTLLADLGEGKMTYPLLCALERCPELVPLLEAVCAGEEVGPEVGGRVASQLRSSGVVDECLALARKLCEEAIAGLSSIPDGVAKSALVTVARATPERRR
ncbi:polyprenyl synthetase family protein [Polyangium sorediatum]|uniref:Polyprenyl synthetase family protein n=1 Tax=Polyangium sorediatum TaxID=889274 RepID=A0ABT6NPP9_9BACT|nr:polyprenyl synthetase family protein [Polyangium sorediatum]MDI1430297.1 polyprenyl synthetase family protein [Polyangium sorediatum]